MTTNTTTTMSKCARAAAVVSLSLSLSLSLAVAPTLAFAGQDPDPTAAPAVAAPSPQPAPAPAPVAQDLGDAGWTRLLGVPINVQRLDGIYVYGTLLTFDAANVSLQGPDGVVRQVPRSQVLSVQLLNPTPASAEPLPKPGKPPIVNQRLHDAGTGLVIGGVVFMGLGAVAMFTGFGVALDQLDADYLLYISVPGVVGMVGVGLPMLIAGGAMRGKARSSARFDGARMVWHEPRRGRARLELGPGGLRF